MLHPSAFLIFTTMTTLKLAYQCHHLPTLSTSPSLYRHHCRHPSMTPPLLLCTTIIPPTLQPSPPYYQPPPQPLLPPFLHHHTTCNHHLSANTTTNTWHPLIKLKEKNHKYVNQDSIIFISNQSSCYNSTIDIFIK